MELFKNTRVVFNEEPHTYVLDGQVTLMGVTTLMAKHGISANYDGISQEVLNHAASLGTMAHKAIEDYCNGEVSLEIPLIKSFKKINPKVIATEYLVSDNATVASSVDLVVEVGENEVELWDMKRTSSVHKDALAWQLGIYKYLFEMANPTIKVVGCKCLPIKKGNKDDILADTCGRVVKIEPVAKEEVVKLIDCEFIGDKYEGKEGEQKPTLDLIISGEESVMLTEVSRKLFEAQAIVKAYEAQIQEIKDRIYYAMVDKDIEELVGEGIRIKLKKPYESTKFDTTRFKKEHPELIDTYTKVGITKGNITININ